MQELLINQGINREAVEELSRIKSEPDWLRKMRLLAWSIFESSSYPSWRGIDFSAIRFDDLYILPPFEKSKEDVRSLDRLFSHGAPIAGNLLQLNSSHVEVIMDESLTDKGVVFTSLERAAIEFPEMVKRYFFTDAVKFTENKFVAMNGALWTGGMFLYIPPHTEVTEPLQFSLIADDNQGALFPHLLVVVDEGSSITLVDHSTAANGEAPAFVSGIVEIFARSSSRINYLSVQDYGSMSWNFTLKRAILSADSQILWGEIGLGSRVSRVGVEVVLREPGANAQLMGIYFGRDGQHLEYDTLQLHEAPHAKSDLLYKGALKDKARSVFHGLIRVNPGAQGTDAYQANRNLLLSNQARANSLPTLEIEANDVRCTHGATVGPIDPEQLFYLMGRGIDRQLAERLLVLGFFNQVLQHIPLEYVRERVQEHIEQQMK